VFLIAALPLMLQENYLATTSGIFLKQRHRFHYWKIITLAATMSVIVLKYSGIATAIAPT